MALTTSYLVTTKNLEAFLNAIQTAQAPERFTNRFLTQLDFTSSNDRLYLGLLKSLGFLDQNGTPTQRYYDFLDQSQAARVLADGVREAYEDLFAIRKDAYNLTVDEVKNKLRTLTLGQKSDNVLTLMANTFKSLSEVAEWETPAVKPITEVKKEKPEENKEGDEPPAKPAQEIKRVPHVGHEDGMRQLGLHYNIQIHLPESRDPAVFEAIFQALKGHLL
jgi:hypothetical protein